LSRVDQPPRPKPPVPPEGGPTTTALLQGSAGVAVFAPLEPRGDEPPEPREDEPPPEPPLVEPDPEPDPPEEPPGSLGGWGAFDD
jgi:hypothetical protein